MHQATSSRWHFENRNGMLSCANPLTEYARILRESASVRQRALFFGKFELAHEA
jgi:hypothetical protein